MSCKVVNLCENPFELCQLKRTLYVDEKYVDETEENKKIVGKEFLILY